MDRGSAFGGKVSAKNIEKWNDAEFESKAGNPADPLGGNLASLASLAGDTFRWFFQAACGEFLRILSELRVETVLLVDEAACRAKLQELSRAFSLLESLVSVTKKNDSPAVLSDTIRFFGQFLSFFLGPCWAFLQRLLVSMAGEVVFAVKTVQRSTRQIQSLCAHAKLTRNSAVLAYVPKIKKQLERLIYAIRETLKKAGAEDAFWMGNLKNRYLNGEEVSEERDLGFRETGETGETARGKGRKRGKQAAGRAKRRRVQTEELAADEAMEATQDASEESETSGESGESGEPRENWRNRGNEELSTNEATESADSQRSKKLRRGNKAEEKNGDSAKESSDSSESSESSDDSDDSNDANNDNDNDDDANNSEDSNGATEDWRVCNNHILKSPSLSLHRLPLRLLLARLSPPRALRVPLLPLEVAHRRRPQVSPLLLHVFQRSLLRRLSLLVPSDRRTPRNRAANAASRATRPAPSGSGSKASPPSILSAR